VLLLFFVPGLGFLSVPRKRPKDLLILKHSPANRPTGASQVKKTQKEPEG